MKRPSNLIYSVAEEPPKLVCLISGLQQVYPGLTVQVKEVKMPGGE